MSRRTTRRLPALLGAVALLGFGAPTAAGLAAPAPAAAAPAAAAPATNPAAGWLARQFVAGERLETVFDGVAYPDYGLTADAVLGLAASGTGAEQAGKATTWLTKPANITAYIGDGTTSGYAGATAKLLLLTQVQGGNPAAVGGVDLPARLLSLLAASGRFSDKSQYGDYSNAFGQSLAIIALERTATGAPDSAVTFLAGTQCTDGGFPLDFGKPACLSDEDSTGLVVQALLAAGATEPATKALNWLVAQQQASGGFGGSGPTEAVNGNSTALAGQALQVGKRDVAVDKAVAYLTALQVGCTGPVGSRGAIAYDSTPFNTGTAIRATSQALLALAGVGLLELDGTTAVAGTPSLTCATAPTQPNPPAAPGSGAGLPITGTSVTPLFWIGGGLIVAGLVVVVVTRTRRRTDEPAAEAGEPVAATVGGPTPAEPAAASEPAADPSTEPPAGERAG